ncbi:Glycosyltransferase [Bifidobacterium sp. DSM 109958]|uniref:Glycosyltransferase n=1 Tax=Bifidobacterium moraviense TaxID=2675323 RepID=A0A7Y0F185_9BIFI|nr:glycosyltransferase family 2 protein [Bifidobacterium sp. DSM 109958]NMN00019.1 Glycosyltransferase [Bifidobacterium sp. DSM 109958]
MSTSSSEPVVSVILPVYGVERYLDEAVASVTAQTYRNIEIILVDDGSKDRCPAMCDAWAAKDDRIRVIHRPNGGLSAARNTGLAAATGDFVYFMDSDDVIEPDLVQACVDTAVEYGADLVMFQFDTIGELGQPLKSQYRQNEYDDVQQLTCDQTLRMQLQFEIEGYFWAFMAATPIYRDHGFSFPEGRKIEDLARICNVIGEARRIVRIPRRLYHYRLRSGSIMRSWNTEMLGDWLEAAHDRADYISTRHPDLIGFMAWQTLMFLGNIEPEIIRQSLLYGLKLDPDSQRRYRARINEFIDEMGEGGRLPERARRTIDLIRNFRRGARDGDGDAENGDARDADADVDSAADSTAGVDTDAAGTDAGAAA